MDITKGKESVCDNELRSLTDILCSLCPEECRELNPLQYADSSSKQNNVTEASDHTKHNDYREKEDHFPAKRSRNSDYHAMMEKKRRKKIKDKINILQAMTPNSIKSDFGGKLEDIIEYMRSLKHQHDVMSMVYRINSVYMPSSYGTRSPYTYPWAYYASEIPIVYHQDISYIPQFNQGDQVVESANKEITKSGKRTQNNQSRDEIKKRKRIHIKQRIETLKQMLGCTEQEDVVLSLVNIVDKIRELKNFVESYYRSMGMEVPPWQSPYDTPMMPCNAFSQGESSGSDNQMGPDNS